MIQFNPGIGIAAFQKIRLQVQVGGADVQEIHRGGNQFPVLRGPAILEQVVFLSRMGHPVISRKTVGDYDKVILSEDQ